MSVSGRLNNILWTDGLIVVGYEGRQERPAEYLEELYSVPPNIDRLAGDASSKGKIYPLIRM